MKDTDQLKVASKKLLGREHLLSKVVETFLHKERYCGVGFTSLMERMPSSMTPFGIDYRIQGENNPKYLRSDDFQSLLSLVKQLVQNGDVQVLPPETYNHINRTGFSSIKTQLALLDNDNSPDFSIYPTENTLKRIVKPSDYKNNPYGYKLALCEPQFSFAYFNFQLRDFRFLSR